MRIVLLIAAAAIVAAVVGASAGGATTEPKPCLIMERIVGDYFLTETAYAALGRGGASCQWSSKPPSGRVHADRQVLLNVFHERSATYAKADYTFLTKQNCTRVAVRGADAACANTRDAGKATSTRIVWLRGSYMGWLAEAGPDRFGSLANVKDDLADFLPRIPR